MSAEHFIPLRRTELASRLLADAAVDESQRAAWAELQTQMATFLHAEFYRRLETLKQLYAPFDPDLGIRELPGEAPSASRENLHKLFDAFDELAERANYRALTMQDLNTALNGASHWGLHLEVDINVFDRLEIYARGNVLGQRQRRRLRNGFRIEQVDVPVHERLIVMFRLSRANRCSRYLDVNNVFIKLFKDIPQLDLDMLLPATTVKMSLLDRLKIVLPTMSGLAIAVWKILQGALLAAFAGIYGVMALLGLVGGTIGYGIRSFYGYLNTRNKYQLSLTESLYYQNLDNNAGVFFRLLDDAEEQENCEALLAYHFLWEQGGTQGLTAEELDAAIEAYLPQLARRTIDFEVADALTKLQRMGLLHQTGGRYTVPPPAAAVEAIRTAHPPAGASPATPPFNRRTPRRKFGLPTSFDGV